MFKVFAITLRNIVKFSQKVKKITSTNKSVRRFLILISFWFGFFFLSYAQVETNIVPPTGTLGLSQDSIPPLPKNTPSPLPDSLTQTQQPEDSIQTIKKGDIETTIVYSAQDSIRATLDGQIVWLYGDAKINYGDIELEANEIIVDYTKKTLTAHGTRDSTGQRVGYPIFKDGGEMYETKDIVYNFETGRARISEVVTKQGEGFLAGETVFKNEKNEIFSIKNSYTTCDLEHPHFRIRSTKTKAIPKDIIVSGPFYMEFNDIPLPIGFAFGMFPAERESISGILFPSYGEDRRRGFNLRNGGYFFDLSEYIKLALTGDIYSKGGHALYVNSNYSKRYHYNGSFNFSYSKTKNTDKIENQPASNDFRITWSHTPQTKGTGRFSASVNAATSSFNKNNNLIYGYENSTSSSSLSNISTKLSSNISYSKKFKGTPFSMGLNLSHNQDLITKIVDLPLPNLTLNMTNIYPFQRKGKTGPLDNFVIGYSMAGTNRLTNNLGRIPGTNRDSIAPFTLQNLNKFLQNARNGIRHTIPLSYSFKLLNYLTVSPSLNYEEKWYFEKLNWKYIKKDNQDVMAADTIKGFNRIANYSTSASLTTRIFGTYFFEKGSVKAIRHVITPNVGFSYTPDFAQNNNYFQWVHSPKGDSTFKSRHEGFVYGVSNRGKSGSIGFGLGNNLEMKIKTKKDTAERKIMLLNNLSIHSSYNLMADSFKLAPFNISANTNILNNLININLSATLDPYTIYKTPDENGKIVEKRVDQYAWNNGGLGRFVSATLAMGTNLNPEGRKKEQNTREKVSQSDLPEHEKEQIIQNPSAYIDFEIPWDLSINYSFSYGRTINQKPKVTQSIMLSGKIKLTEQWAVTFNSGYHIEKKEFTQTDLGISRDLHCWTLKLWWVPFGYFQSYNFTIAVKSSLLKDLKLERRKPFYDNL